MRNLIKRFLSWLGFGKSKERGKDASPIYQLPKKIFNTRKVVTGRLLKLTPGKRHGWFDSNIGPVKKPLNPRHRK